MRFLDACVCVKKNSRILKRKKQHQSLMVIYECGTCGLPVSAPVFGEDPETLSEHSILAVSHG